MFVRSRSAAGLRRYSGIFRIHPAQEVVKIERLRLPSLFALDQRLTDRVDFQAAALLLSPDKIAHGFAAVSILSGVDLRSDPGIDKGDCLMLRSHD